MLVREYYERYSGGEEELALCDFGPEGNHLNIRKIGSRLDLVDDGCRDTGTDSSNRDVIEAVNEWLQSVEARHLTITTPDDLPVEWSDPI